jgi:hypothetical protein
MSGTAYCGSVLEPILRSTFNIFEYRLISYDKPENRVFEPTFIVMAVVLVRQATCYHHTCFPTLNAEFYFGVDVLVK